MFEEREELSAAHAESDTENAPDGAKRDGFDEKLEQDVASSCADGHADAYFGLIGNHHGNAFRFKYAEHGHRNVFDADYFSDGVFIRKQLIGGGLAENTNFGCGTHVGLREHRPFSEIPLSDGQVVHALT